MARNRRASCYLEEFLLVQFAGQWAGAICRVLQVQIGLNWATKSGRSHHFGRLLDGLTYPAGPARYRTCQSAKIEGFAQPMKLDSKPNVRHKAHQPARPPAA
jgi:hypothetical protein